MRFGIERLDWLTDEISLLWFLSSTIINYWQCCKTWLLLPLFMSITSSNITLYNGMLAIKRIRTGLVKRKVHSKSTNPVKSFSKSHHVGRHRQLVQFVPSASSQFLRSDRFKTRQVKQSQLISDIFRGDTQCRAYYLIPGLVDGRSRWQTACLVLVHRIMLPTIPGVAVAVYK